MIDLFTIKPLDSETVLKNARETKGRIITVEDHYPEGRPEYEKRSIFTVRMHCIMNVQSLFYYSATRLPETESAVFLKGKTTEYR